MAPKVSPNKGPAAAGNKKPSSSQGPSPGTAGGSKASPPKQADSKQTTGKSPDAKQPRSAAGGKGTGEKKGVAAGGPKKGNKEKKGTVGKGNASDSDSESVGSNASSKSNASIKSNKSDKSNKSNKSDTSNATKASKASKGTIKTNLSEAKAVKEVTGQQLMSAVNDFDKRALQEYIDFHKEAGPLTSEVINFANNGGNTPLMMACQKPKDADAEYLVKMLLEMRPVINLNYQSRSGNTALHYACKDSGLPSVVSLLLEAGADFQIKNADGHLPADLARLPRIVQQLRHYLELRLEAERMAAIAEIGVVLYEAVAANDAKKLQVLINREPPDETYSWCPEPRDQNHPPLRLAVDRNYLEIVRMLILAGADGKVADRLGRTPLIHLCAQKRVPSYPTTKLSRDKEAVRWSLLQALTYLPQTVLECRDKNGETAFHHACNNGYQDDMRMLVEVGCDVNARQISPYPYRGYPSQRAQNGDTALIIASRKGDMAVVKCLVEELKADVNLHGNEGMTALMWAAWHKRHDLVKYLHSHGANINAQSYFGQTALMWTMENMDLDTAMYLLDLGYDPEPIVVADDASSVVSDVTSRSGGSKSTQSKAPPPQASKSQQQGKQAKGGKEPPPPPPDPNKTPGLPPRAADPNVVTKNNASPLIVLCRKAKSPTLDPKQVSACIDLLASRGANIDIRSTDGLTALMWSVINNDQYVCRQLLFLGADPTIKDNLRLAPLDVALSQVIKMLLKNAVEAYNEAKAEKEKREKELAEEMAAALAAANANTRTKTPEAPVVVAAPTPAPAPAPAPTPVPAKGGGAKPAPLKKVPSKRK